MQVFPIFAENVLAGRILTYGYYAKAIGRDPATEAVTIGPAMHTIGAVCVFRELPVAPLHFVKRLDRDARQIFASDPLESALVLPHFEMLRVVASKYPYTQHELDRVEERLREVLVGKAKKHWTPHYLWRYALLRCPKDSEQTYFEMALAKYQVIQSELKSKRIK